MPWWRGGLAGYAGGSSSGIRHDAASAASAQRRTEPSRLRRALSSPPAPQQMPHDAAATVPDRLQRWQLHAYHAYHQSGMTLRKGLELRSLARQYIVQEAVLLDLVQQWTARNPRVPLGDANMNRSSKAWDSIAIAALGTELQGLFPTALCAMYCAIDPERKLAAGIASSHHSKDQPSQYYSKKQAACDAAVTAAWAARRVRDQAAARQREAQQQQQQEVDDRVRLGRARRTVAAAERALHTLEQQVAAAAVSPALLLPAEAAAAEARAALDAGRRHLAHLEQAVAAGERSRAEPQQRRSGAGWRYASQGPTMHTQWQHREHDPGRGLPPLLGEAERSRQ